LFFAALVSYPGKLMHLKSLRLVDSNVSQTGQTKLSAIQQLNYRRTLGLLGHLERLLTLAWHAQGDLVYLADPARWQDDVAQILPHTLCQLEGF